MTLGAPMFGRIIKGTPGRLAKFNAISGIGLVDSALFEDGSGVNVAATLRGAGGNWSIQTSGVAALAATTINAAANATGLTVNATTSNATGWGLRIVNKKQTTINNAFYALGLDVAPDINIAAGVTDSGYFTALRLDAYRDKPTDQGILSQQYSIISSYGHIGSTSRTTGNVYGLYLVPYFGGGTISSLYDIYINPVTGGSPTNHYAIYQASTTAKNTFLGRVGLGTSLPVTPLDVAGSTSTSQSSIRVYRNLAHYSENSTQSGAIDITMPTVSSSTMMIIEIDGYDYSSSAHWKVIFSGYPNSTDGNWSNARTELYGNTPFQAVTIGKTASNNVIRLGAPSTVWNYPKIVVSKFTAGFSNIDSHAGAWTITRSATPPVLSQTISPAPRFYTVGQFSSLGSGAGYYFDDRVPGYAQWAFYAFDGIARVYAGQDRFTIDQVGNFTFRYDTGNRLDVGVSNTGVVTLTPTGTKALIGKDLDLASGKVYQVNGVNVVGARKTGWTAATGAVRRTGFDTSTVTLAQLAEVVKAMNDDLISHGLLGA